MKTKFIVSLVFLLLAMSSLPSAADTLAETEHTFIMRESSLSSTGSMIRGIDVDAENGSKFQLLASRVHSTRIVNRYTGSPEITRADDQISIDGELSRFTSFVTRNAYSIFQKDEYIEGVAVGERVREVMVDAYNNTIELNASRTVDTRYNYDDLVAHDNFTMRELTEHSVTAFIRKSGDAFAVRINDTSSIRPVRVYAFRFVITIALFDSNTHEFIGVHHSYDSGYGNALPTFVNHYLERHRMNNSIREEILGGNRSLPGELHRIPWISLGYNETLGLDMFQGRYHFNRDTFTVLLPRVDTSLQVNAFGSVETALDQILLDEQMQGFEEDNVDAIEDEMLGAALDEDGVSLDEPFTEENDTAPAPIGELPFNYLVISLVFLAIFPALKRRILKN